MSEIDAPPGLIGMLWTTWKDYAEHLQTLGSEEFADHCNERIRKLTVERDALAAKVARAEALVIGWEHVVTTIEDKGGDRSDYDSGWTGCLRSKAAHLRAALAGDA